MQFLDVFRTPQERMQEQNIFALLRDLHYGLLESTELFGFLCYVAGLSVRIVAVVSPDFFGAFAHHGQTRKEDIRSFDGLFGDPYTCNVVLIPCFIPAGQDFNNGVGHWVRYYI